MTDEIPPPVAKLKPEGQAIYDQICIYLMENDLLHKIDTYLVYQAAVWHQLYLEASRDIDENGSIMHFPNGTRQVAPGVTNLNKAHTALGALFTKLGIGEAARQKLKIMETQEDDDPMANL